MLLLLLQLVSRRRSAIPPQDEQRVAALDCWKLHTYLLRRFRCNSSNTMSSRCDRSCPDHHHNLNWMRSSHRLSLGASSKSRNIKILRIFLIGDCRCIFKSNAARSSSSICLFSSRRCRCRAHQSTGRSPHPQFSESFDSSTCTNADSRCCRSSGSVSGGVYTVVSQQSLQQIKVSSRLVM